MNKPKKNKVHSSPSNEYPHNASGLLVEKNGIVIDTTDDAFNGGVCLNLTKLYK